jgi:hypothetical protein
MQHADDSRTDSLASRCARALEGKPITPDILSFLPSPCRWHPDVSKEDKEVAEVRFLQLSHAYEFLMRRLHGGGEDDAGSSSPGAHQDWGFHDW